MATMYVSLVFLMRVTILALSLTMGSFKNDL